MRSYLLVLFLASFLGVQCNTGPWRLKTFPLLRSPQCGPHFTPRAFLCDPDMLLPSQIAVNITNTLTNLAASTPCHCQRKSQCQTESETGRDITVGFVVGMVVVRNVQTKSRYADTDPEIVRQEGDRYATRLRSGWALGDCGNSALIFYWHKYKKISISLGRLANKYITSEELSTFVENTVDPSLDEENFIIALHRILRFFETELKGDPEEHVDIGTLFLIASISIALILVFIIAGCVCAFRCCGNLHYPEPDTALGRTLEQVERIRTEIARHGSIIRRSISRGRSKSPPRTRVTRPDDDQRESMLHTEGERAREGMIAKGYV